MVAKGSSPIDSGSDSEHDETDGSPVMKELGAKL